MGFTTATEGDHVVATLTDGSVVRIHKDLWAASYAHLSQADLAKQLEMDAAVNKAVDK